VCVFREVLEATACRLFCIRASQSERVALTELNHKFKEAFRKKNSDAIIELDLAIHKHILTCARASVVSLYSATATLMTTTIANSRGHSAAGRVYDSVNEHDPLVMACINPDPEEAERAGRKHVRADLQKWLEGD
jgi:DNA-binding GntR family transcriptional regulator